MSHCYEDCVLTSCGLGRPELSDNGSRLPRLLPPLPPRDNRLKPVAANEFIAATFGLKAKTDFCLLAACRNPNDFKNEART